MCHVRHPTIGTRAPSVRAAFGERRDARLQELIRGDPEEVRDAIEVLQRHAARVGREDVADPRLRSPAPLREVPLRLPASTQQGLDVLLQEQIGFHQRVSSYHGSACQFGQGA